MMNNNLTANFMQILDIIQHIVQIRKLIRFYYAFRQNGGSDHENWRGPVTYYCGLGLAKGWSAEKLEVLVKSY